MKDYKIVKASSINHLANLVKDDMRDGYAPIGGVSSIKDRFNGEMYCQAMLKDEPTKG